MAEAADAKDNTPAEEAPKTLGNMITKIVGESPQGITASEILTAVRKENKIAPAPKSGDINGFLYKNTTTFEIVRKGAGGAPYWKLKAGSVSPTISCSAMFANIAATCPNAERLLGSLIQALVVEGV